MDTPITENQVHDSVVQEVADGRDITRVDEDRVSSPAEGGSPANSSIYTTFGAHHTPRHRVGRPGMRSILKRSSPNRRRWISGAHTVGSSSRLDDREACDDWWLASPYGEDAREAKRRFNFYGRMGRDIALPKRMFTREELKSVDADEDVDDEDWEPTHFHAVFARAPMTKGRKSSGSGSTSRIEPETEDELEGAEDELNIGGFAQFLSAKEKEKDDLEGAEEELEIDDFF